MRDLPVTPSQQDINVGSDCKRCRSYFNKTGPECQHCKLEDVIKSHESSLVAYRGSHHAMVAGSSSSSLLTPIGKSAKKKKKTKVASSSSSSGQGHILGAIAFGDEDDLGNDEQTFALKVVATNKVDCEFLMIVKLLKLFAQRHSLRDLANLAMLEVKRVEAMLIELQGFYGLWNRHLELLKLHDELEMVCTRNVIITTKPPSVFIDNDCLKFIDEKSCDADRPFCSP